MALLDLLEDRIGGQAQDLDAVGPHGDLEGGGHELRQVGVADAQGLDGAVRSERGAPLTGRVQDGQLADQVADVGDGRYVGDGVHADGTAGEHPALVGVERAHLADDVRLLPADRRRALGHLYERCLIEVLPEQRELQELGAGREIAEGFGGEGLVHGQSPGPGFIDEPLRRLLVARAP